MFRPFVAVAIALLFAGPVAAERPQAATSPWGPNDQIGRLNLMTDASRAAVLSRIAGGKVYDRGTL